MKEVKTMTPKEIKRAEEKKSRQKKHLKQIAKWTAEALIVLAVIFALCALPEYIARLIG